MCVCLTHEPKLRSKASSFMTIVQIGLGYNEGVEFGLKIRADELFSLKRTFWNVYPLTTADN